MGKQRQLRIALARGLRVGMGTFVALEAEAESLQEARTALERAWEAVQRVERLMHPSRTGSDLDRIASAPCRLELSVDPDTWRVLELARQVHTATQGIFDPCLPQGQGRLIDLELLAGHRVRKRRSLQLDLGGIAKGHAVDLAIQAMQAAGCAAGLVNAGGDLRTFGGRRRRIHCAALGRDLRLCDAALAVSLREAQDRPPEHRGYYRRDRAALGRRRVAAIIAPTAAIADALTKFALVGTCRQDSPALRQFGARLLLPARQERHW